MFIDSCTCVQHIFIPRNFNIHINMEDLKLNFSDSEMKFLDNRFK